MADQFAASQHPVNIEDEMKRSYMDYAMSVIIGRALPDARDGLKPAHRRVLYGMKTMGLSATRGYRKCAKIVGEVMGAFHPHGDQSIYDTLVRLAQDFNMRYPLVDGQGNFGSMDNDPPAAMRYTEARLTPVALEMLADIDMETVDWVGNYDNTRCEVADALLLLIEHPDATVEDLCQIVPGPDFPTGGIILGDEDVRKAYATGHGRVLIR